MLTHARIIEHYEPYYFEATPLYEGATIDCHLSPRSCQTYKRDITVQMYYFLKCWGCLMTPLGYPIHHAYVSLVAIYTEGNTLQCQRLISGYSLENGFYSLTISSQSYPCYFLLVDNMPGHMLICLSDTTCQHCPYDLEQCKALIYHQLTHSVKK